jgi:hypothetical protein
LDPCTEPPAVLPDPLPRGNLVQRAALRWLADHPGSSAQQIATAIGERSPRYLFMLLDRAACKGWCEGTRDTANGPWLWKVPVGCQAQARTL